MCKVYIIILSLIISINGSKIKQNSMEVKNLWFDTCYYPITLNDDNWKKYNLDELIDILNPPEQVLKNLSSEKLADLMFDYPLMWMITTYNDTEEKYEYFFMFLEENCSVFIELLRRPDGYMCLMKEYQDNPFDVDHNNKDPLFIESLDQIEKAELFGCQFIRYYNNHFNKKEYEYACEVIEEKVALYSQLENKETREWFNLSPIDYSGINRDTMIRGNYNEKILLEKEDKSIKIIIVLIFTFLAVGAVLFILLKKRRKQ